MDNEELYKQQIQNLANALRRLLIAVGVLNTDVEPNGPELIMASEEYIASLSSRIKEV